MTLSGPSHLCAPLIERVRRDPDGMFAALLARGEERRASNRSVLCRSLDIGRGMQTGGAKPGDLVIIVLEHGADLYSSFLGCLLRGFVPSFLPPLTVKQDPDVFRRSMAALFARIAPAAVLTSHSSRDHVPSGAHAVVMAEDVVDGEWADPAAQAEALLTDDPDATAFLQHSSGTTGLKKGVMLSHRAVLDQIALYGEAIGAVPGDVVASWLPLYHDMGLITGFLLPAVIGLPIVSLDALEWVVRPTILLDAMERHRAAFAWMPDFAFHHLLRASRGDRGWDLSAVKALVSCSEPCRAATFVQFAGRFGAMGIGSAKLLVCYAMAETVFAVTQTGPTGARAGSAIETKAFLSCGRALPGVEIEIRDGDGQPVAPGTSGEICLRSPTLFAGYFRQPDATAARLRDGWYHTQDLGCLDEGELFVLGRIDDLLIVNGRNLFAHEIEDLLNDVAGLVPGRSLACCEYDDRTAAARLLILAEPVEAGVEARALEAEIRRIVLAQTGLFAGAIRFLPRGFLVKSSSGKIARAESLRKFRTLSASSA